jgi:hypothetical protein
MVLRNRIFTDGLLATCYEGSSFYRTEQIQQHSVEMQKSSFETRGRGPKLDGLIAALTRMKVNIAESTAKSNMPLILAERKGQR